MRNPEPPFATMWCRHIPGMKPCEPRVFTTKRTVTNNSRVDKSTTRCPKKGTPVAHLKQKITTVFWLKIWLKSGLWFPLLILRGPEGNTSHFFGQVWCQLHASWPLRQATAPARSGSILLDPAGVLFWPTGRNSPGARSWMKVSLVETSGALRDPNRSK